MTPEQQEKLRDDFERLIDLYVAPNQRATVKKCLFDKADYRGTVRINASAIPVFRNVRHFLTTALQQERERIRKIIGEHHNLPQQYCADECPPFDHQPTWDGNFYTCYFCGKEFVKKENILKALEGEKSE